MTDLLSYDDAVAKLGPGRNHVLIGNGFSIACDPIFKYDSLYDGAVRSGLSARAQEVFERIGTNNFEGVMKLLDDAHWVAGIYGLLAGDTSDMLGDVEIVKKALVEAVATSHPAHTGAIADSKKSAALQFLLPYHNVFTTNYDLLSYWVTMTDEKGPQWGDGFREDEDDPDAPYVVFAKRLGDDRGLFYLHGALHLFVHRGDLCKHAWVRTGRPLTELIKQGLDEKRYPLFVAEGSSQAKLEQIQRSGYLWYCLDKFSRIENSLVVFGHSFGEGDQHIAEAIAANTKLSRLLIGVRGEPKQALASAVAGMVTRREARLQLHKRGKPLDVTYYDSESARIWG